MGVSSVAFGEQYILVGLNEMKVAVAAVSICMTFEDARCESPSSSKQFSVFYLPCSKHPPGP
jgi:hypothetical protein